MFDPKLISATQVECALQVPGKESLLQTLSNLLAAACPYLSVNKIFNSLWERESLGNTGLGYGVALPHARIKNVTTAYGAFVQIAHGIDYASIDGAPVDLALALLVPAEAYEEHLRLLAQAASLFNDEQIRARLRAATSPTAIVGILQG